MKKIICILTIVLLVGLFAFFAFGTTPVLRVTSAECLSGGTCTVRIFIENNPGMAGLFVVPEYDRTVLTLTECDNGSVFDCMTSGKNILWDSTQDISQDGCLATLTFSVSTDAKNGTYDIGLTVRSCTDSRQGDVSLSVEKGLITVTDGEQACILKNSDTVKISSDGFLRIAQGTTVRSVRALTDYSVAVANGNGTVLYDDDVLTTGCTVQLSVESELHFFVAVIPGDVSTDGIISAADARLVLRRSVLLENYPAYSAQYAAADVDGQSGISAGDARLILRASVQLENSLLWIK